MSERTARRERRAYNPARLLLAFLAGPWSSSAAQAPDVVFVATPLDVARGMLSIAGVNERDLVYDLGSGDGRIVIAAAKHYGARAVGIEIDSNLVVESRRSADSAGVGTRAEFRQGDLFETDLRQATVVTLYLGRTLNERLRPKLFRDLRPGSRVVSQNFDMGDWVPDSVVLVRGRDFGDTPVHLWVMPAEVSGTWEVTVENGGPGPDRLQLQLGQRYQQLTGTARSAAGRMDLRIPTLRGDRLAFTIAAASAQLRFQGRVEGNTASGTVTASPGAGARRWRATRLQQERP